jgi:hypothetical protein
MFKEETKIEPNLKEENKEDEEMEEFKAYLKAKHPDD